ALTKVDLVDEEWRQLAHLELDDHLEGTFLGKAEVVDVAANQGTGVDDLRAALDRLLADTPTASDRRRPRLWVDRSFAAKGSGTVVTGTLAGGPLAVDDELVLLPSGRRSRVRSLQSHQAALQQASPGRRLAVNLTGVSHDQVARGDALVRPYQWAPTRTLDCSLTVLNALDHDVSRRGAYQAYVGSGEHPVRLRVLGAEALAPGTTGAVRLHLPVPLPLLPGDLFVLRESGRAETVGGGEVLDVAPVLRASRARPSRSVERVVAERGWVEADLLERLTGERREPTVGGRWVVDPGARSVTEEQVRAAVEAAGPLGLDTATLDERQRSVLETLDGLEVQGGRATVSGQVADPLGDHPYLAALEAQPFSPPAPNGVDRGELRELGRRGLAVERDGVWFAPRALDEAATIVAGLLSESPEGVTVAQVRDALGTTRKYILPVLAHLDATGVTRRRGDLRIGGPRLPEPRDQRLPGED
ncbi:MAG: SelB C-terminal domain-containing protein, partial [Actinobacteria bacterium]|nr:SelB C-terminal domain-containing protein [Actinomycetota bacterium]